MIVAERPLPPPTEQLRIERHRPEARMLLMPETASHELARLALWARRLEEELVLNYRWPIRQMGTQEASDEIPHQGETHEAEMVAVLLLEVQESVLTEPTTSRHLPGRNGSLLILPLGLLAWRWL